VLLHGDCNGVALAAGVLAEGQTDGKLRNALVFVCLSSIPGCRVAARCGRTTLVTAPLEGKSVNDREDRCLAWISVHLQSCTTTSAYGRRFLAPLQIAARMAYQT